jgi:hypothetical protein
MVLKDTKSELEFRDRESQLENINEIFNTARTEDGWNMEEEMLYSYFFVGKDVDKLETLGLDLEKQGYDFIDIFELGDEETEKPTGEYLLHIDKVEIHTPDSLAARNVEFQNLADEYEIESYDGWEFGEVGDEEEEEEAE